MVNYSYNVLDEHGTIRGVALIDTKETSKLRLVPNDVVTVATSSSSAVQPVESLPTSTGAAGPPVSSRPETDQVSLSCDLQLSDESSDSDQAPVESSKKKEAETRPSRSPGPIGSSKTRRRRRNSSSSTSSSASSTSTSSVKRRRKVSTSSPVSDMVQEKRSARKTVDNSVGNSPLPSPVAASTPIIPSQPATAAVSASVKNRARKRVPQPGSSKEPEGDFNIDNYIDQLEQNRNAKQELSAEKYSRLSQPFSHGWKRECMIGNGGIATIVHVSPTSYRCSTKTHIQNCLEKSPEGGLTLQSFELRKIFLGFSKDEEKIVKCKTKFYTDIPEDQVGQKQPKWGKMVFINSGKKKGVECLFPSCNKFSSSIPVHNRHVIRHHTAPTICPQCGMSVTATYWQKHLRKHENKNLNEKETSKKRKDMKPNGNENNANANNYKSKDRRKNNSDKIRTSKDPKRIQGSEPGPSRSGNINHDNNNADTRIEVKKEKNPEESPAEIGHQEAIKTKSRDDSLANQLGAGQKASLTFAFLTDEKDKNGGEMLRKMRVKIEKLKTLNQHPKLIRKLKLEAGLDHGAVLVCQGNTLSGEETGENLDGKMILLKKA